MYVLSRVTLGADIAITSVMLDAANRDSRKLKFTLWEASKPSSYSRPTRRIRHFPAAYPRSGHAEGTARHVAPLWTNRAAW